MNLPRHIAKQYLFSKSNKTIVNVISGISIAAIAITTCAMFVILAGFSGLELLLQNMHSTIDPPLKVVHSTSSYWENNALYQDLKNHTSVAHVSRVLEREGLLKKADAMHIANIIGIDSAFLQVCSVQDKILFGDFLEHTDNTKGLVIGQQLSNTLGLSFNDPHPVIELMIPKAENTFYIDPRKSFRSGEFFLKGTFSISKEYNESTIFASLPMVQQLTDSSAQYSALYVSLKNGASEESLKEWIATHYGSEGFVARDRKQQHADIYKYINLEQLFIILVFVLIIVLASFNVLGSMTILILEKKHNIRTLHILGAPLRLTRLIFWWINFGLSFFGLTIGLALGTSLVALQRHFSLLRLGSSPGSIAYPVSFEMSNLILISSLVLLTTIGIASVSMNKIQYQ